MENYRLKSKVSVSDKEFLVQTTNDSRQHSVISSLFVDGEVLEIQRFPHSDRVSDEDLKNLVKSTHDQRKLELEQLLALNQKILKSGDSEMMCHLGTAFYHKRMFDEAAELFESILVLKPAYHQASNYLGLTRFAQGDFEAAVRALASAVETRPGFADYHNNYGEALLEAGFCRRAVEEFETALNQNIYYADAQFNLAIAYISNVIAHKDESLSVNLVEKTTDIFNRALLITSEFKCAEYEEACELLARGDLPRALQLFKFIRDNKKEAARQKDSGFYVRLLLSPDLAGDTVLADRINYLLDGIEKNPNYVDLRHELALCYLRYAQIIWRKAIDEFEKTIEINPRLNKSQQGRDRAAKFAEAMNAAIEEIAAVGKEE